MNLKLKKGIGLLVMVTLIAIGGIMITISARVFENMARQTQLRIDQTRAHYLAQAGVMRQIWNWYVNNTTTEGSRRITTVNTTAVAGTNLIFKAGMDANGSYLQSNYAYVAPISHTGIVNVRNLTTAASKAAGTTTLAATVPAAGAQVGDFLVIYLAMDDGGGVMLSPPAIDTQNNTYYLASDVTNAAHVRTVIIYGLVETALVNPNTITARWTNNVTAKAMCIREFTGPTHLDTQTTATGNVVGASSGSVTSNTPHELVVGAVGVEGPSGDTFTVGTGYTLVTRATTGNVGLADIAMNGEYKIVNATAGYVGDGTLGTAREWAAAVATFYGRAHWYNVPASANRRLRAWRLQNINSANSITLTQMKVSWTGGGAAGVNDIKLNNVSVIPAGGPFTSGTTIDITDTALTFGSSWSGINTYIQWDNSGPADPTTVTCQFIFNAVAPATTANSDVNSDEVVLWDGLQAGSGLPKDRTFKVTATGQVNQTLGKYFKVLKTVNATVSGAPGIASMEIEDWDEGEKNIP